MFKLRGRDELPYPWLRLTDLLCTYTECTDTDGSVDGAVNIMRCGSAALHLLNVWREKRDYRWRRGCESRARLLKKTDTIKMTLINESWQAIRIPLCFSHNTSAKNTDLHFK